VNTGDRFIELNFLLLDFEVGKKRYAYKIEGLDKDWNYTNENSIHLSGLPYGNFTLRVKGQNSYGAWSKCELSIPLVVITPYYRSAWFILLTALLFFGTIFLVIHFRTRQLGAAKTKLEGIVGERTAQLKRSLEVVAKEKKLADELLLNILPGEVAHELKTTGSSAARHFDDVTVMFTDFVNFTSVSAGLSPQELVNELDICYKAFDAITSKYGIEKIKTVGDAYLAAGGLPVADPLHAAHVVAAAIEIRDFMATRKLQSGARSFDIRIGVHSGSVVAGIVGIKKFAYDIWGDTVNTAARMEQKCDAGKINVSETTYELVKNKFECEYRGEIETKGKGAMKMYFINK
jgi:class 3 adenylate cyclase